MRLAVVFLFSFCMSLPVAFADYEVELRRQIKDVERKFSNPLKREYFRDMGIIARKADEAELTELTTEIVGSLLIKKMEEYVDDQFKQVNILYFTGQSSPAGRALKDLKRYEKFYQPTDDYLRTTGGQVYQSDLIRMRKKAMRLIQVSCADVAISTAIAAVRQTGVFVTNAGQEIKEVQTLAREIDCCLSWKPEIKIASRQEFESEYEKGIVTENARLRLKSSRSDMTQARWEGDWIYEYKGVDGTGKGASTAVFNFKRGSDIGDLRIANAKLSSVGRFNFPSNLSGANKTVEVGGSAVSPSAALSSSAVAITGCHD